MDIYRANDEVETVISINKVDLDARSVSSDCAETVDTTHTEHCGLYLNIYFAQDMNQFFDALFASRYELCVVNRFIISVDIANKLAKDLAYLTKTNYHKMRISLPVPNVGNINEHLVTNTLGLCTYIDSIMYHRYGKHYSKLHHSLVRNIKKNFVHVMHSILDVSLTEYY